MSSSSSAAARSIKDDAQKFSKEEKRLDRAMERIQADRQASRQALVDKAREQQEQDKKHIRPYRSDADVDVEAVSDDEDVESTGTEDHETDDEKEYPSIPPIPSYLMAMFPPGHKFQDIILLNKSTVPTSPDSLTADEKQKMEETREASELEIATNFSKEAPYFSQEAQSDCDDGEYHLCDVCLESLIHELVTDDGGNNSNVADYDDFCKQVKELAEKKLKDAQAFTVGNDEKTKLTSEDAARQAKFFLLNKVLVTCGLYRLLVEDESSVDNDDEEIQKFNEGIRKDLEDKLMPKADCQRAPTDALTCQTSFMYHLKAYKEFLIDFAEDRTDLMCFAFFVSSIM